MENRASQPPQYLAEHLREALAKDPRVSELDIRVEVRHGRVTLTGTTPTEARREAISAVAREVLPGYEIHNYISLPDLSEAVQPENLP